MTDPRPPRRPQFHRLAPPAAAPARDEITAGLLAEPPQVAPKYFYDALGSALFTAITSLDEYGLTRAEAAILQAHVGEIAAAAGRGRTLVDLGAGDGRKAARLFGALQPRRYVAVDISADYLAESVEALQRCHPGVEIHAVALDFSHELRLPPELLDGPLTLFYPGSSIGNFAPAEALAFLRRARALGADVRLLIGVDLVKDAALLDAAYDDALGVTAAFNLNLLRHLNRLVGSDFDVRDWRHVAFFDPAASRVEMHLQARSDVVVRWPGGERRFAADTRIHTENSYKYRRGDFEALLRDAGFARVRGWTDADDGFAVFLAD